MSPEPVTRLATRVLAPNPGPMTLEGTNTWVLRHPDGGPAVVVDPGPLDEGHLERVAGLGPVALIVLTHHHFDHSQGAGRFRELTGAPIVARDESLCVDAAPLKDNASSTVAGVEWMCLLTPGHSADSISLLLREDRSLLTGDTVLGRGTTIVAHPDGRLGDYLDSLRRLRDLADSEIDTILPGHGPVVEKPLETLEFYLAHRQERLDQVRAALAAGDVDAASVDPMDVVRRVYSDVDESLWPAAEVSVKAQLEYLAGRGD